MAHVMKIKQGAVAPLVAHYERTPELERGFVRGNIDPSRTALNYNLLPHDVRGEVADGIEQHERTAGKAIRKDANVLFDWVVTMPKDCPPERGREFFEAVAAFMRERYGEGNVLGCYVHMDELRRTRTCRGADDWRQDAGIEARQPRRPQDVPRRSRPCGRFGARHARVNRA